MYNACRSLDFQEGKSISCPIYTVFVVVYLRGMRTGVTAIKKGGACSGTLFITIQLTAGYVKHYY